MANPTIRSLTMDTPTVEPPPFHVVTAGPMRLVGVRGHIPHEAIARIPDLWQRFAPHIAALVAGDEDVAWGAVIDSGAADAFDYIAAVAVSVERDAAGLDEIAVPAARWATVPHHGHVSAVAATCAAIFSHWDASLGTPGRAGRVTMLERYGPGFDPAAGQGDITIWVPLAS